MFTTDAASEKVAHLRRNDRVEACWYLAAVREQYRVRGTVVLVDADSAQRQKLRRSLWVELSAATRQLFEGDTDVADVAGPPRSFVLGMIFPSLVRHLDLRSSDPAERVLFDAADTPSEAR